MAGGLPVDESKGPGTDVILSLRYLGGFDGKWKWREGRGRRGRIIQVGKEGIYIIIHLAHVEGKEILRGKIR